MRKEEMREFGEALARYRNEAGLNQRQLAAAIGLDSTQVNKIERGHRPPLDAKYMKPLVRALRLSRSEALDLVQKADLSPKVLDFMDEVQAPVYPGMLRKKPMQSMANPTLALPNSLLYTAFEQIEARIKSRDLSKEQMKRMVAGLTDSTDLLLEVIKPQHKKREED